MADMLSTGISGLMAFQTALATTSHNTANVNTPGYSRQVTDLATRIPEPTGSGFIGTGVNVVSVQREYDQFLTQNVRTQTTLQQKLSSYQSLASQVDNMLSDSTAGLAPALQQFFNSVQGVSDTPSSASARQVMISEGQTLVNTFHTMSSNLSALNDSVNTQLSNSVNTVNSLADSIASLNKQISMATGQAGGQPPNDLLDQRDQLLQQLSAQVPVSTVQQSNGAVNVFIGNGQVLVLDSNANHLQITSNSYDIGQNEIALSNGGPNITAQITSGAIGGALAFRSTILQPAENSLGQVAIGLSQAFNVQQTQGMDLNNALGTNFFGFSGATAQAKALPSANNTAGGPTATYAITDANKLTSSDYILSTTDGVNYTLTRSSDNQVVGTYTPTPGTPVNVPSEGFSFTLSGAGNAGDSYEIQPTRAAAGDLTQLISDPSKIAAASPVLSTISASNLGTATVTNLNVSSTTNLPTVLAGGDMTFTFDATNNQFNVSGALTGTIPYNPSTDSNGKTFDLGTINSAYSGLTFTVSGAPLNGDAFTIGANSNAANDNTNALKLAAVDSSKVLGNSTLSLQDSYSQIVSDVGAKTNQANTNLTSQNAVVTQAQQSQQSVSGVNLDEEAANMLKYQQGYQACAQMITVAKTLFNTLINAVG